MSNSNQWVISDLVYILFLLLVGIAGTAALFFLAVFCVENINISIFGYVTAGILIGGGVVKSLC